MRINVFPNKTSKCIPVKDWLEKFLEYPRQGSFKETFTRFIWKYVDPHFLMSDDYFASIPSHLKIKYEVINDQGKMIDLNEDLDLLKKENKKNVEAVVERIQFNIEQDGITSWPIDELPIKVEQTINEKKFEEELENMATDAKISGAPNLNPKVPTINEMIDLYRKAWRAF